MPEFQTIEEVVKQLRDEDCEGCEPIARWLEKLQRLKYDDTAALENALDALRRMHDKVEFAEYKTVATRHHANRLRKLIQNIEELVELGKESPTPVKKPRLRSTRGTNKRKRNK